ncbi:MAG: LacI family transcriptional regulator [Lachnospiraceae bacterium]|nr:LacI family transcriptional regulator [Lachnospiraceae bacterium]
MQSGTESWLVMVSIKDVAKHAGVAISTVSKVLNHYPNVSEEMKVKVAQAVEELNFVPNSVAAALSSKQAGRVALLVNLNEKTQAIDEIGMQYISGAVNKAMELNLDVITLFFFMFKNKTAEELIRYLQSQSITGIIIYGISKEDKVLHGLVESRQFKCVVVDTPLVNENTSSIGIDHRRAQYDVAKKTIEENNCKRILYIAGKRNGYVSEERLKGMNDLAEEIGLTVMVRNGDFSELQARNIVMKYAKNKDAVVCASDLMAIGAMKALTEMDIFRPVCGFDGIILMGYVGKQMNTVGQDFAGISQRAMEELQLLMSGEKGRNILMEHTLIRMRYEDIIC